MIDWRYVVLGAGIAILAIGFDLTATQAIGLCVVIGMSVAILEE